MKDLKNYNDTLLEYAKHQENAKKILNPSCKVCKICNGRACAGRFTNSLEFGAKGNNGGFTYAVDQLAKVRIVLDPIHEDYEPDPSIDLFGKHFELPVFASPIALILTDYTFDSPYFNNNDKYADALLKGCWKGGGMAWLGDNKNKNYFEGQCAPIKETNGVGVPTIKPWANREEYWRKMEVAKECGAMAIATDVDAIGLGYQYSGEIGNKNYGVCSRTTSEIREMVERAGRPFIIKGIMSAKAAVKAAEAGVYGILISNHGGNVVENSLAPCDVIKEIKDAVGDSIKVFADGGVRSGEDVFKMLALGADAVGIGRPYVQAVYGGGEYGAQIYTHKIYWELVNIMRLTDCRTLKDINRDRIVVK